MPEEPINNTPSVEEPQVPMQPETPMQPAPETPPGSSKKTIIILSILVVVVILILAFMAFFYSQLSEDYYATEDASLTPSPAEMRALPDSDNNQEFQELTPGNSMEEIESDLLNLNFEDLDETFDPIERDAESID